jgi:hypothetical protein
MSDLKNGQMHTFKTAGWVEVGNRILLSADSEVPNTDEFTFKVVKTGANASDWREVTVRKSEGPKHYTTPSDRTWVEIMEVGPTMPDGVIVRKELSDRHLYVTMPGDWACKVTIEHDDHPLQPRVTRNDDSIVVFYSVPPTGLGQALRCHHCGKFVAADLQNVIAKLEALLAEALQVEEIGKVLVDEEQKLAAYFAVDDAVKKCAAGQVKEAYQLLLDGLTRAWTTKVAELIDVAAKSAR